MCMCVCSEEYRHAVSVEEQLVQEALEELEDYCSKNSWLSEIHCFCTTWNESSVDQWRGGAAFTLEVGRGKEDSRLWLFPAS